MSSDPKQKALAEQLAEIERELDGLVHANFRLEDEADRLADLPRRTALRQADIDADIRFNKERIKELEAKKAALTGGTPPS